MGACVDGDPSDAACLSRAELEALAAYLNDVDAWVATVERGCAASVDAGVPDAR